MNLSSANSSIKNMREQLRITDRWRARELELGRSLTEEEKLEIISETKDFYGKGTGIVTKS